MGRKITMATRNELVARLSERYQAAGRSEKSLILDEFVKVSGYHRKHATRVLGKPKAEGGSDRRTRRIYDEAVRQALAVVWEASDRICGKRLKALLPSLVSSMEKFGHLSLDETVRTKLLAMSPATIDRVLTPTRSVAVGKKRRRQLPSNSIRRTVPIRTFADWGDPLPGFCEADFVAHCGGSMAGSFLHTMTLTDIASCWTEGVALVSRQQELVAAALDVFRSRLPMKLLGLDTDNDGAFINETIVGYCREHGIEFTRSRPYRSNDQAWVEQKNGAVVRRLVGYDRHSGLAAARVLTRLLNAARLYVNFFQPSFKLREKIRTGAKVSKRYYPPETPCDRLLGDVRVTDDVKRALITQRETLDPVQLLKDIRDAQEELATGSVAEHGDLDRFLKSLPERWREGDGRAKQRKTMEPRTWRTRIDPFEDVWPQVEAWLRAEPDATAKELFSRLEGEHPGRFGPGQLRTLQRRTKEWRRTVARVLIGLTESQGGDDRAAAIAVMST